MKLLKYFLFLMILSSSIYFLIELNELNEIDRLSIKIKIPFLDSASTIDGFNVWMVLLITFTVGVIIGFLISLVQMISLKSETLSLKSKNKKVQIELDALRNQGIEDEIQFADEIEESNISL